VHARGKRLQAVVAASRIEGFSTTVRICLGKAGDLGPIERG